jgi:plasmid replication initiation protein
MTSKKDSFRVVKSNLLIESRYKMSLQEMKMFLLMVKHIDINDKEFKKYKMYIRDFIEDGNIRDGSIYSKIDTITDKLLSRVLKLKVSEHRYFKTHFMASIEYEKGWDYFIYDFHPSLREHLLRLKKSFTPFDIRNVINCNSVYSIRIYTICKEYEDIGERIIDLDELKYMLSCEDTYKRWADFRRFVLQTSQKELKKNSDIYMTFEGIKKGRKIRAVKFTIKTRKQQRLWDNREEYIKNKQIEVISYQKDMTDEVNKLQKAYDEGVSYSDYKNDTEE